MLTKNDILRQLEYKDAPEKEVHLAVPTVRKQVATSVKYYFDIIHTEYQNKIDDYCKRVESQGDNCLPFQIDTNDEGIQLCKELCAEWEIEFTKFNENTLRDKKGKGKAYLIIIERPIWLG